MKGLNVRLRLRLPVLMMASAVSLLSAAAAADAVAVASIEHESLSQSQYAAGNAAVETSGTPSTEESSSSQSQSQAQSQTQTCGIYLAPSTIPGAGMGMFTGRSFEPGQVLTMGDVAVPLVEMNWHNGYHLKDGETGSYYEPTSTSTSSSSTSTPFLWDEYTWSPSSFPGMAEEGEDVTGASFGIGAAVNCFFPLINAEDSWTALDTAGLHRSIDPGAGAFTPYHDRQSLALNRMLAGEEIFVDYGYAYFTGREEMYGPVPLLEDYDTADALLQQFVHLRDHDMYPNSTWRAASEDLNATAATVAVDTCHAQDVSCSAAAAASGSESESESVDSTDDAANDDNIPKSPAHSILTDLWQLVSSTVGAWDVRVHGALAGAETADDVDRLLQAGGTGMLHYNRSIRNVDWLEEHGTCMDHIRPGQRSTIPQAGRGAFANRFIAAGSTVAPAPLIHVPDRSILTIYDSYQSEEEFDDVTNDYLVERNASAPIHHQLMLNYCFGHRHSTLLLCPYGVVTSLINHSRDQPNTKIMWSDRVTQHPEWLDRPVEDWARNESTAGLAFDFVALRDIQEDEEILIDYGAEWETAWQKHVAAWQPPSSAASYRPAYELDADIDSDLPTVDEEGSYEHVEYLDLLCREEYRVMSGLPENTWDDEMMYPCRIVDRFRVHGETFYTAEIYDEVNDWESATTSNVLEEVLFAVPRGAFCFEDTYYSRDHAQKWSLRHDMRIPDELMPTAWMNLLEGDQ